MRCLTLDEAPFVQAEAWTLELCTEHARSFEGESPLPNLMEVKG